MERFINSLFFLLLACRMEKKELIKREDTKSIIAVYQNNFSNDDVNYNVIQINKRTGVQFGNDVFMTLRKLNNYLKRWGLCVKSSHNFQYSGVEM